jgi:GTP-binding protein EngB required for normal cell division
MDGCFTMADRAEAVFIGRSNVGKSAWSTWSPLAKLWHLLKRPGKTQQFNFFAVNKPGKRRRSAMVTTFRPERSRFILYCGRSGFGYQSPR